MNRLMDKIKSLSKKDIFRAIKNFLYVLLGTIILSIGTELFIVPAGLVTGGVSGMALCFTYAGVSIQTETIITIITWALFFVGLIFLGWRLSLQTLVSTLFYPICLFVLKWIVSKWGFLLLMNSPSLESFPALVNLLSALFGAFFVGAGCAITFYGGGSTGGVDIIAFTLCKYFKWMKSSVVFFCIDATIVILGFVLNKNHDIALCLEGVLSAFITASVIDRMFTTGSNKTFVAYIVTDKYEEITNEIIAKLDRTTSILDIQGGYSKENKKMVMVSFSMRQYAALRVIVVSNDKRAFMTINKAHEISGEGFKPL